MAPFHVFHSLSRANCVNCQRLGSQLFSEHQNHRTIFLLHVHSRESGNGMSFIMDIFMDHIPIPYSAVSLLGASNIDHIDPQRIPTLSSSFG